VRVTVEERELACPSCGHCWYADCREDRFGWLSPEDEGDVYCPVCGVEGEA
jgi:DNA-directed RNA polymerase subunit RPC12/RpoP